MYVPVLGSAIVFLLLLVVFIETRFLGMGDSAAGRDEDDSRESPPL